MKQIIIIFGLLCLSQSTFAQLERVSHQTFDIEEVNNLIMSIAGEVEVQQWAGNTIMTETKIKLYDASPGILDYFLRVGRYQILMEGENSYRMLKSKDSARRPIRTRDGECYEEVKVRIFVPSDFNDMGEGKWERIPEATDESTPVQADNGETGVNKD